MSPSRLPDRLRALAERLDQASLSNYDATVLADAIDALETRVAAMGRPAMARGTNTGAAQSGASASGRHSGSRTDGIIRIWSDGSCSPNPGAGGWGTIVERDGQREELSGAARKSTNNIMEMTGAIEGLRHTPPGSTVHVTTDSQYLVNGATKWIKGWKRKGWRKADGEPVLNRELWESLDALLAERKVTWEWVRGHVGHPENERCDELANAARAGL